MLRPITLILAVTALAVACGRVEEPKPSTPAVVPVTPATSPAAATSAPQGGAASAAPAGSAASAASTPPAPTRCQVPLSEVPPPRAMPAKHCPPDPEPRPVMPRGTLTFVQAKGAPALDIEMASTPAHREHGLMHRTDMKENEGMLFSWPVERPRTFWMRNTCVPLDMLFLSRDGLVVGILEQVPVMNDDPRTVPCPAAHVLEVNAGWVRRYGVKVGHVATIAK